MSCKALFSNFTAQVDVGMFSFVLFVQVNRV